MRENDLVFVFDKKLQMLRSAQYDRYPFFTGLQRLPAQALAHDV